MDKSDSPDYAPDGASLLVIVLTWYNMVEGAGRDNLSDGHFEGLALKHSKRCQDSYERVGKVKGPLSTLNQLQTCEVKIV